MLRQRPVAPAVPEDSQLRSRNRTGTGSDTAWLEQVDSDRNRGDKYKKLIKR